MSCPCAGALALLQRRQNADGGEHAAHHVVDRSAGAQRPARRARSYRRARPSSAPPRRARRVLVRAGQKALERAIDQARVVRFRALRSRGPSPRARRDGNSRSTRRRSRSGASPASRPLRRFQVEREAPLVAVEAEKKPAPGSRQIAACCRRRPTGSTLITSAPRSREHEPAGGPHHHVRELDDADAVERQLTVMATLRGRRREALRQSGVGQMAVERLARQAFGEHLRASISLSISMPVRAPSIRAGTRGPR